MSTDVKKKLQEAFAKITGEDKAVIESLVAELVTSIKATIVAEGQVAEEPTAEGTDQNAQLQRLATQRDQFLERAQAAESQAAEALGKVEILTAENTQLKETATNVETLTAENAKLKEDLENTESRLREQFEENLQTEVRAQIRKIGAFIESKLSGIREQVREEVRRDPSNVTEASLFREISQLIESHTNNATAKAVSEPPTALIEENTALKAQVRLLESQSAKFREEAKKNKIQPPAPQAAPAPAPVAEAPKAEPVVEVSKPAEPPTKKEEAPKAEEPKAAEPIQEAAKPEPKKSRASELLKESLEKPVTEEVAAWIGESRQGRIERSGQVAPKGIPIGADDLIKEVATNGTEAPKVDGGKVVRGTGGMTVEETRRLAGIPAQ